MNLGEQILSDLVAALKDLYPNIEVESTKKNYLLFYQSFIFKELS
jgi:hypothetical protein